MSASNARIASLFDQMADLLEIRGENPFRVRAYRNAARIIQDWPRSLKSMIEESESGQVAFPKIPGIGSDLAAKIRRIVLDDQFPELDALKRAVPPGLLELLSLPGLGPKRAARLHQELRIDSMAELERALRSGAVSRLHGFGRKLTQGFLRELEKRKAGGSRRTALGTADRIAVPILETLRKIPGVSAAEMAGSLRRRKDLVGDIDLLVACSTKAAASVSRAFLSLDGVAKVLSRGKTRCTVELDGGLHVDLRIVPPQSFGAALHYFTGSKAHNIAIRALGVRAGLKINEYGIYRGRRRIGGADEGDVFRAVGLPFIEPELRENSGEIEAAREHRLPRLITLEDIRGDLHSHTRETDGRNTLREMVLAARGRGYEYLAITDHSRRLAMAHGLDPKRLAAQIREIDRLNDEVAPFRILKACEVDILEDGSLDLPDSILSKLDLTVCSVHSRFHLSPEKQLSRVLRAMDHPLLSILGHPTGRLIGGARARPPMALDIEKVLEGARDRGVFVELNSQSERLDLADHYCKLARELGVLLVLSTDSHAVQEFDFIHLGLSQARRAWLEPQHVLNTRPWSEIERLLDVRRRGLARGKAAA
jgi:DNA polymerase (family 10)